MRKIKICIENREKYSNGHVQELSGHCVCDSLIFSYDEKDLGFDHKVRYFLYSVSKMILTYLIFCYLRKKMKTYHSNSLTL